MPDLMGYKITRLANASITTPRWQIDGKIVDSQDQGKVITDITANNIIFPNVLGTLTTAQQDAWVQQVVLELIYKRFNIG